MRQRRLVAPEEALVMEAWVEVRLEEESEGAAQAARWKLVLTLMQTAEPADRQRACRNHHKILVHPPTAYHNFCKNQPSSPPGNFSAQVQL